jgi:hypothetical protein
VIDAESRAAKRAVLVNIRRETGSGQKVLARVEKLHPGDPHRQIGAFFQEFSITFATGRKRTVNIKTEELYVVQLQVVVRQLSNFKMPLKNLSTTTGIVCLLKVLCEKYI